LGGHHDQVAALGFGGGDDAVEGLIVLHMHPLRLHARRGGGVGCAGEHGLGLPPGLAPIFGFRVGDLVRLGAEEMEALAGGNDHKRRVERCGERDSMGDRKVRQRRAVGGDENFLVHGSLPQREPRS
jgi:hypothetical protein